MQPTSYLFPSPDLLRAGEPETTPIVNHDEQQATIDRIVDTFRAHGVEVESIHPTVGPTFTRYEVFPCTGTRILQKIKDIERDILFWLAMDSIRIIAPIPGKAAIGIEVPNAQPQIVSMHSVIASQRFQEETQMCLPVALGRTVTNEVFLFDLAQAPHLLIAGESRQGKSVTINAIITSLLYKKQPAELKFVLMDLEAGKLTSYTPLFRHYLATMPATDAADSVITDCDRAIRTLNALVSEMDNRYDLLRDAGVRNIEEYNERFRNQQLDPATHRFLPRIVIIIDEYSGLIEQAGTSISRIMQRARTVGMHLVLATGRPSVNIVTGVIKANIPTRIALRTLSAVDSRTVLDAQGAENLIGRGDLLYSAHCTTTRLQCAFVDTPERDALVSYIAARPTNDEPYRLPDYIPDR